MTDQQHATGTAPAPAPALVAGRPRPGAAVAVCIPVYQGAERIAETLGSVLDQTRRDVEVVVLDNASTDGTAEVLAGFVDPRLAVWRSAVTVPMLENFNRAVGLSSAPLVKLLPADDLLVPRCLERQVAVLEADPGLAVVAGRADIVDHRGAVLARRRFLRGLCGTRDRTAVLRRVVRSGANPIGGDVAVTFRRAAFDAAGGYDGDASRADVDLQLRMLEHGRFHGQDEVVASFRVAPGTHSASLGTADYTALRAFVATLAADPAVRGRDVLAERVGAPLARLRRELLFAVARRRARRDGPIESAPAVPARAGEVA